MKRNIDPNYWNNLRIKSLKKHPLKRTPLKKSGKPIRKRSVKRVKQENKYNYEAKKFKEENPNCEARLDCCTGHTTDVHHKCTRTNSSLLEKENWLPVCRPCHQWITENSKQAIALGLSERRNTADRGKKIY